LSGLINPPNTEESGSFSVFSTDASNNKIEYNNETMKVTMN